MSEAIVKRQTDGTVTVCIDEKCVTVPSTSSPSDTLPEVPIDIEMVPRDKALGDVDALDWQETSEAHVTTARHADGYVTRYRPRGDV